MTRHPVPLDPAERTALIAGLHGDPFAVLGPHQGGVRVLAPGARAVTVLGPDDARRALADDGDGLYSGPAPFARAGAPHSYRLEIEWPQARQSAADPYAFGPVLPDDALRRLATGDWQAALQWLGARLDTIDGVAGLRCALWAPNARRVAVVGDFNSWDPRRHGMRLRHLAGVWELFIPGVDAGAVYKFAVTDATGAVRLKADPHARRAELPPATASVVDDTAPYPWTDDDWMRARGRRHAPGAAIAIYEVHAGSWLAADGDACPWRQLADKLPAYAASMGFTHIELMPIMEHPFGGSWGYQPLGLFAPSARFGPPAAFAHFVDRCHAAGLGVILDWVPAHFPDDPHGLARLDGTALYEYDDPREGYHPDWHTLVYNLGRTEVRAFMIASALHWLQRFHIDGLRVDAVASMLYRDYSRRPGEWIPNRHGGRENLEAVDFVRTLNQAVRDEVPDAMMIAEESTAWPGVTAPVADGGLGFHYKWNMGWMHDTLRYLAEDPVHRKHHHGELTFSMVYAYAERYVLPLSHDEVVHGKGSLLRKMPGDDSARFANLRAYLGYMWAHPGKKLLFMGGELAQPGEWNHDAPLDWNLLDDPRHRGVQRLVGDLNHLYRAQPALHARDADPAGFAWVVLDDADNSVVAFLRTDGATQLLAVCNFTPVARGGYRVGVPLAGRWDEVLNTDAGVYGGAGIGNLGQARTGPEAAHGHAQSLLLTLPPLSTLYFLRQGE
ncbi:1,4-alpha-glucan branching protein GlgB [Achromobacter ruhlandii]|uniref:1,4-alpha-glucan branching protein GlgB n=1 Tax=Achromobacter ruhlandii TaxID=72557 RepID=UPI000C267840|nr:1,4-alpha-glucan branching protein GlgB [Achromobacter ruhlandii]MCV6796556.1 1,4-alpha-glucan branching protein GlgB [Achromobacter ruhlandii]MCV6804928.1 1,4-alpha-glucan branching protein GlgB [Achromobacter ruhlandii]MCV6812025.1 1,4-alpha-glucan branching protein GlgB [Achromobacter ruhlandii]MCV6821212.1 1,4-alpha-glucan branching protein GlgB [Achromobacter ruhlandii]PJM87197.1 1,4-alpha-glucan branching enzyme [Achromobacter ruhlandii]